jgi:RHS repeat-associated protein
VWFAGELVGMTRAGALYQIDNDHLGRPELITNANKAIVWQSNNDPFGGMNPTTNTLGEFNLGLPGQYFDAESNYWYNMNRYYVPALGRYLQADPIGLAGGLNPYAYVGGNPAYWVDPLGLSGTLVINSSGPNDGFFGSGGVSGHSWISFTPDGGTTTTYGTWGNNPNGLGNGLHENLEAGRVAIASRTAQIDDEQEKRLKETIANTAAKGEDGWGYLTPCSSFAADAWNNATGESLSPYGPYSNPSTLMQSIFDANGGGW